MTLDGMISTRDSIVAVVSKERIGEARQSDRLDL